MHTHIQKNHLAILVVGALVLMGGSFYAGRMTAAPAGGTFAARGGAFPGGPGNTPRGARGGGFAGGPVLSKDDTSITIKSRGGGSQVVLFTPSTQVFKSVSGTMQDIATGKDITVTGTSNSDGSVTAQTIQVRNSSTTPMQFSR